MEVSRAAVATCALLLALGPAAQAAPLAARAGPAPADGVTLVPVEVSGGPERDDAEREDQPALPAVTCAAAASLPPSAGRAPVVVAPFRVGGGTLDCTVRLRGEQTRLNLTLRPPLAGAYAALDRPAARAGDRVVAVRGVVVGPDGQGRAAARLRAAASAGVRLQLDGPRVDLVLPPGAAPRAIAVVLDVEGRPAAAFLPVKGRVEIPVRTRNARTVNVRLPGGYAGPFEVRGERVSVPVDVPPGVATAVVRALSARGEAKEELVDLHPPRLPRLAALGPAGPMTIGATHAIFVAIADERGAPAAPTSAPRARAGRGTVAAAVPRGPGLWEITYRAPTKPGDDRVAIDAPGDPGAGAAEVDLRVLAGPPRRIRISLPRHALTPGAHLAAPLTIRDAAGNLVTGLPLRASLGRAPATLLQNDHGYTVVAVVPARLEGRSLRLRVEGHGAALEADVSVRAGLATTARLSVRPAGRRADVRVAVADRHGNPVDAEYFHVHPSAGDMGDLRPDGREFRATLEADQTGRECEVEVRAGGQVLARERVRFAPPPGALRLGAWGGVAWLHNLGDLSAPRFGGGPALRRAFGPIELTLATGVEGVVWSDTQHPTVAGSGRSVDRHLTTLAIPVSLRARLPLPRASGVAVAAGLVPTWARGRVEADFQETERFSKWAVGARGEASGDLTLGPGRVALSVGYGYAALHGTPITGNIDGLYVRLGYELWFWTLER
jgi:hypothetical protein